ncbi:MAG: hypothetical protein GXO74_14595 [Calditrichaeota bacterium]|nr:hypothetical protein [Calditrichota bacterium]
MKILFSEHKSDYVNYIFPYAIWAIPEKGETPAQIFAQGFLPASRELDRFYMTRHIRIDLKKFSRSSENRRILRKGDDIAFKLLKREEFDYTDEWREFCKYYADIKFGKDVMSYPRLESLFNSKIINHILLFTDTKKDKDIGIVTLYFEEKNLAYYYYSFYDLSYYRRNLGMFMMTSAVDYFSKLGFEHIYLGTCYSRNALYKTQFSGCQFFNGFRWSENLKELKFMVQREQNVVDRHLLETDEYLEKFYDGNLQNVLKEAIYSFKIDEK